MWPSVSASVKICVRMRFCLVQRTPCSGVGYENANLQKCSSGFSSCHQQAEAERCCQSDPWWGADCRRLMLTGVAVGSVMAGLLLVQWALCGTAKETNRSLLIHYKRGRWKGLKVLASTLTSVSPPRKEDADRITGMHSCGVRMVIISYRTWYCSKVSNSMYPQRACLCVKSPV